MSERERSTGGGDRKRLKKEDVGADGAAQTGVAMPDGGEKATNDTSLQASPYNEEDEIEPGSKVAHGQKVEEAFAVAIKAQKDISLASTTERAELKKLLEEAQKGRKPCTLNAGVRPSMEGLYRVCRQPSSFDKFCGKFFQWELSYKTLLNKPTADGISEALEDAAPPVESDNSIKQNPMIPRESRLVLSIKGVNSANEPVWIEWLNIRERPNGKQMDEMGLFSSRRFAKGEIIGPYCGEVRTTREGPPEKEQTHHTPEIKKAGAIPEGPYVTGKNGIWGLVSPWVRENGTGSLKLLLGFQYMVSCRSVGAGNGEANVEITENGFVVAAKTLKKGAELISPKL